MTKTLRQFDAAVKSAKDIFMKKMYDYGTAWRILRTSSITDQVFIKAQRIRSIEEKGKQKIEEDISSDFIGIFNYAVIALIQLHMKNDTRTEIPGDEVEQLFDLQASFARKLMQDKNHDYGEAWREMRISSLTDLILMKLMRIKQIEEHKGQTLISEGIDANYYDVMNYAIFALIRLTEKVQYEDGR
jgi:Nucleotide modification associated domain 1